MLSLQEKKGLFFFFKNIQSYLANSLILNKTCLNGIIEIVRSNESLKNA